MEQGTSWLRMERRILVIRSIQKLNTAMTGGYSAMHRIIQCPLPADSEKLNSKSFQENKIRF